MSQRNRIGRYLVLVSIFILAIYYIYARSRPEDLKKENIPRYLVVQHVRNQTVRDICGPKRPLTALNTAEMMYLLKHLIVDDEHQILYCYVPKAACANWKRVMQVLGGKYKQVEDIHKVDHTDFKFLSGYSPEEIEYRLNNYFKYLFVRHPLDRLYSAWHNKFHEHLLDMEKKYGVPIVTKFRENPPPAPKGDDVTLVEFLKYIAATRPVEFNEHWMPFVNLCQPCYVHYNYIGVYENLEVEATTMLEHLKLSHKVQYPPRQRYYDKNSVPVEDRMKEWRGVPKETFDGVMKKFATDFGVFGYQLPGDVEEYIRDRLSEPSP